ncbi:hypothetical protein N9502_03585 [Vicingaceae bacterium]|nr:hypothetical protein [Vicingaceae bacterium]
MDKPILNLETFELQFFIETKDHPLKDISDDEINEDVYMVKENMESRIPTSAIYLGPLEDDIEHGATTWVTQDEYYIYPLQSNEYDWALFRICWDDNWGRWEWSPDGRLKGLVANYKEAARLLLCELWGNWQLDLNDSENNPYVNFLKQFK